MSLKPFIIFSIHILFVYSSLSQINIEKNDTLYFNGFKGINFDVSEYNPIFINYEVDSNKYKIQQRFKADTNSIKKLEKEILLQYVTASKEDIDYFLKNYKKSKSKIDANKIYEYIKTNYDSVIRNTKTFIQKNYSKWDREYFGFYVNGRKKILIHFTSDSFKKAMSNYAPGVPYVRTSGASPVMMYDIDSNKIIFPKGLLQVFK